jgi:hypothetical protein
MAPHRASHLATWVELERLSPSVLPHLDAAKERPKRPRFYDTEAVAEELANILMSGRRPTIGRHRRHRATPSAPSDS